MYDYIIVGSGISGALCAAYLKKYTDSSYLVLEKNDHSGGRFATHTIGNKHFNIGNLFLRDSHNELVMIINHFLTEDLKDIRIDYVNLIDTQYHIDSRHIFLPESGKMSDICSEILTGSRVHYNESVEQITHMDHYFEVKTQTESYNCQHIIMTAPAHYSTDLIKPLGIHVSPPKMNSIFTFIGTYTEKDDFDFPYYKFINHPVLKEIFVDRNQKTLVIHANDYMHQSLEFINDRLVMTTIYNEIKKFFKQEINLQRFFQWDVAKDRERKGIPVKHSCNSNHVYLVGDWVSKEKNIRGVAESFHSFTNFFKNEL